MHAALITPEPHSFALGTADGLAAACATLSLAAARALYLLTPLLVSAALAGVVMRRRWLEVLNRPLDGGKTLGDERWLGDGKTWRGLVISVAGSCLAVAIQRASASALPQSLQVIDYAQVHPVALGGALGVGAVLGELPNSFVKRRLGIPRGKTTVGPLRALFYVWDQVDTVIGVWLLLGLWLRPDALIVIMSFAIALIVHPLVAWVGYRLGARDTPR